MSPLYVVTAAAVLNIVFFTAIVLATEILKYDPVADPRAVVVKGCARFTVLTDRLIRMEYSCINRFEDGRTIAIVNRKLDKIPLFDYTTTASNNLVITTKSIKLIYAIGKTFSNRTLSVETLNATSKFKEWHYGLKDDNNLLGTIKSLDALGPISLDCNDIKNVKVHDESLHCTWGLVSRSGWAVVDESSAPVMNSTDWWSGNYNSDDVDLYGFFHGHDYAGALQDFVNVAGKIAMTPRYAAGIWWSRWLNLDNVDMENIAKDYLYDNLPLDVVVLDMDFHTKQDWTGYSFDKNLFPDVADTMNVLHSKYNLGTLVNIHDADGVGKWEDMYEILGKAIGFDTSRGATIPFNVLNKTHAYALEDIVIKNLQDKGVDAMWIDWQQGGAKGGLPGGAMNPTFVTDYLRSTSNKRHGSSKRGLVLARWGGLGTHRYQVGFSGDISTLNWDNLAFQPYFSMTSANVAYGFWSHDLVGLAHDHMLHVRWTQWIAYSSIFRTHDRGMATGSCADSGNCAIVKLWNLPLRYRDIARQALWTRASMLPYIYTLTRKAFDSGLSPLLPLYYYFPEEDMAYAAKPDGTFAQYMFGDDLLVAPIVTQPNQAGLTYSKIWVPPGTWVLQSSGQVFTGPTVLVRGWDLTETPVLVRGGAIVATIPVVLGDTVGVAGRLTYGNSLIFTIYPGSNTGSTRVYEDDGATTDYLEDNYANTIVNYTRTSSISIAVSINVENSFKQLPSSRAYTVCVVNSAIPVDVDVNGKTLLGARLIGKADTWFYKGEETTLCVQLASRPTTESLQINVSFDERHNVNVVAALNSGIRGIFTHARLAKVNLDIVGKTPGAEKPILSRISHLASTPPKLSNYAITDSTAFINTVIGISALHAEATAEVKNVTGVTSSRLSYSVALLQNC